jgi:hypothetical protein
MTVTVEKPWLLNPPTKKQAWSVDPETGKPRVTRVAHPEPKPIRASQARESARRLRQMSCAS